MLSVIPLSAFDDNYIWMLQNDNNAEVFVVDPGEAAPVLTALEHNNLTLAGILLTHHHQDHVGGVQTLLDHFTVPVIGSDKSTIPSITQKVKGGDQIMVLGTRFQVIDVPGHTLDHIAFFSDQPKQPLLFCGDTLFAAGCGRIFEGTPQQMYASLIKLSLLPKNTAVYCAHEYTLTNLNFAKTVEPDNNILEKHIITCKQLRNQNLPTLPSSIGKELQINPFLRSDKNSVKNAAQIYIGAPISSIAKIFEVIRAWKDDF